MLLIIGLDMIFNTVLMKLNVSLYNNIEILLLRVPIFIYGVYLAKKIYERKNIEKSFVLINILLFFIIMFLKTYHLKNNISYYCYFVRYITSILAVNITVIISILLKYINNKKIDNMLNFFANISLELYIFHVSYREIFADYRMYTSSIVNECLMLIITFMSALFFNYVYNKIIKIISIKKQKS